MTDEQLQELANRMLERDPEAIVESITLPNDELVKLAKLIEAMAEERF